MPKKNFTQLIDSKKPVLVDFHAEWCGPCKMMAPMLKELKNQIKNTATVIKIDIDKNQAIAKQFQIKAVPTIIVFKEGKELWRTSGMVPLRQLKKVIEYFGIERN